MIYPSHCQWPNPEQFYLGFAFNIHGVTFYAQYTVCPFGLSPIPWLFTKLLKPILTCWRSLGMVHFLYLDDGCGVSQSKEQCAIDANIVRSDLQATTQAGFLID